MRKLLYASASPYSAKVRMAAAYANVPVEAVIVDPNAKPPELIDNNPLGKVPVLLTEDGALFDSRVIIQYLNRISGGELLPLNFAKRTEAERLEALCDGICDCLIAHVYERRYHPQEKIHKPWLDRQWEKAMHGLDHLAAAKPKQPAKPTAGHIALRVVLGYLDLRFQGQWEAGHAELKRWAAAFDRKHPGLVPYLPR